MKIACCLMLSLPLLSSCSVERTLEWTYTIPAALERPNTVVIARIRQGGCRDEDPLLYESRPRASSGETPALPVLVQDVVYCFEVRLQDGSCTEYARSVEMLEVDDRNPAVVVSTLEESPEVSCTNALCDAERGCRPCDGAPGSAIFCAAEAGAPDRCCVELVASCAPSDALLCTPFD